MSNSDEPVATARTLAALNVEVIVRTTNYGDGDPSQRIYVERNDFALWLMLVAERDAQPDEQWIVRELARRLLDASPQ